jgi:excisionase family DNA binding protein
MFDNSAARCTLTEESFAEAVGLSIDQIRRMRRAKEIECIRIGRRVLYRRDYVDQFLGEHTVSKGCNKHGN